MDKNWIKSNYFLVTYSILLVSYDYGIYYKYLLHIEVTKLLENNYNKEITQLLLCLFNVE